MPIRLPNSLRQVFAILVMGYFASAMSLSIIRPCAAQNTRPSTAPETRIQAEQKAAQFIKSNDSNQDGKLSKSEFPERVRGLFARIDRDADGFVTLQEDTRFRASRRQPRNTPADDSSRTIRDIVYAKAGDVDLKLDVHLPDKATKPTPVVIWIHGGGWKNGSKGGGGKASPLLQRGYAVVDIDYRLSGVAIFPAAVKDCRAAVRWVKANSAKYEWDPDRVAVMGSSAGGHLAAMIGTAHDQEAFDTNDFPDQSNRVQAVVDLWGPTDMLQMDRYSHPESRLVHDAPDSPESRFLGGPIQDEPYRSIASRANPITYVTKDDPPFLIIHGDQDLSVPVHQSQLLYDALQSAGVKASLHVEKGGGHGLREASKTAEFNDRIANFLDQHLK